MNEHQKTAQTSKGVLGEGGVALFMVAIMCIVALTAVVSVDVHAEDASKTSDVYSGIATDYDGLADGATYKVASGGIVYIWYRTAGLAPAAAASSRSSDCRRLCRGCCHHLSSRGRCSSLRVAGT